MRAASREGDGPSERLIALLLRPLNGRLATMDQSEDWAGSVHGKTAFPLLTPRELCTHRTIENPW
jgi:hypothetical protein